MHIIQIYNAGNVYYDIVICDIIYYIYDLYHYIILLHNMLDDFMYIMYYVTYTNILYYIILYIILHVIHLYINTKHNNVQLYMIY